MKEIERIALNNFKAGINEAYVVIGQTFEKYHEKTKRQGYTMEEVLLVLQSTQHQHSSKVLKNNSTIY